MISTLTGSSTSKIKSKWSDKVPYITGYDIYCDTAYSVMYGKVAYVGQEPDGTFTVNVKSNNDEILRYGNITQVYVGGSDNVKPGSKIGQVAKFVHFEYATRWQGSSTFPLRVNSYLYFKQDPGAIIEGTYLPKTEKVVEYAPTRNRSIVEYISTTQQYEFKGSN